MLRYGEAGPHCGIVREMPQPLTAIRSKKRPCPQTETKAQTSAVPLQFRALSRFACSRRTASLRLGQNPVPPCGPWAFALASVHPCCSRRLSASLYGTRASYNGDFRRSLLAFALGPRLPGDIRRVRPAALAPCGRLSERFHPATRPDPSLVLFRPPLGADAFYIIGADGICQPFSGEKFHKKLTWASAGGLPPGGSFLSRERKEQKRAHRGRAPYVTPLRESPVRYVSFALPAPAAFDAGVPSGAAAGVWVLGRLVGLWFCAFVPDRSIRLLYAEGIA